MLLVLVPPREGQGALGAPACPDVQELRFLVLEWEEEASGVSLISKVGASYG